MELKMNSTSVIKARLGIQHGGPAHKFFTNECYKAMDKFVPYSGNSGKFHLRENVSMSTDGTEIIYQMPYASYQYHGRRFDKHDKRKVRKYTTPGTGPYWDKRMWSAEKDKIIQAVQKYVETHGGT